MVTSHCRGHKVYYDSKVWRYCDNDKPITEEERPCAKCGRMSTEEGYDACLGHIKGAVSACCGHGVEKPYVIYKSEVQKNDTV